MSKKDDNSSGADKPDISACSQVANGFFNEAINSDNLLGPDVKDLGLLKSIPYQFLCTPHYLNFQFFARSDLLMFKILI